MCNNNISIIINIFVVYLCIYINIYILDLFKYEVNKKQEITFSLLINKSPISFYL